MIKFKIGEIYSFIPKNCNYSKILIIVEKFKNGMIVTYSPAINEKEISKDVVEKEIENTEICNNQFSTYTSTFLRDRNVGYIGQLDENLLEKISEKIKKE